MMDVQKVLPTGSSGALKVDGIFAGVPVLAVALLLVLTAIGLRFYYLTTPDVSWLLTVGEEMLRGRQLYVDLIEVNPPASVYLYLPAVLLGQWTSLSAEAWVNILVFLSMPVSLGLSGYILRGTDARRIAYSPWAWLAAVFVLSILPLEAFAQREHIAVICVLPWLALATARLEGRSVTVTVAAAAGLGAGFVFIVKPPFAAALLLVSLAILRARSPWRWIFRPEHVVCVLTSSLYVAVAYMLHPEFWRDTIPLLNALYIPVRNFGALWQSNLTLLALVGMGAAAVLPGGVTRRPLVLVLVLASAGFFVATLWQGKFWAYHYYPFLALAGLACLLSALTLHADRDASVRSLQWGVRAVIGAFIFARLFMLLGPQENFRPLADAVRRMAPQPSIMLLSVDLGIGHPLTRLVEGRWADRFCSLWIAGHAFTLRPHAQDNPEWLSRINAAEAMLVESLTHELAVVRPDIIVATDDGFEWALESPELARELVQYEKVEVVRLPLKRLDVLVLRRKSPQN